MTRVAMRQMYLGTDDECQKYVNMHVTGYRGCGAGLLSTKVVTLAFRVNVFNDADTMYT